MKQILSIFILLVSGSLLFSQQQTLYSIKEVKEMPVFSSCDGIKPTKKDKMQHCISRELTLLLSKKMANFSDFMLENQITEAKAILQFVVSKEGILMDINATKDSNPLLAEAAVQSLNLISEEIPPIRPAKLKSGESVNLFYQFPLKFTAHIDPNQEPNVEYPVEEIVMFTLVDKNLNYEIRLFKERNLRVFEYHDNQEVFLGKFLSMREFENSEPYKSLIEQERFAEKTLVTFGYMNDEKYEIYIYNLFRKNKPSYVEVVKVEGAKKSTVATFEKEIDFSKSEYAHLIYRE